MFLFRPSPPSASPDHRPSLAVVRRLLIGGMSVAVLAPTQAFAAGVAPTSALSSTDSLDVTTEGAVVDAVDVDGVINIKADDVTVKNSRVTHDGSNAIRIYEGFTGAVVEDTTIICTGDASKGAIAFGDYVARRVAAIGCGRGFLFDSSTVIIDSTWDGEPWTDAPAAPAPDADPGPTPAPEPEPASEPEPLPVPAAEPEPATASASGWTSYPDSGSTGVPAGTALKSSGTLLVREAGAVINRMHVSGQILVDAPNVTIRNSRVTTSSSHAIRILSGSALIEDVDIRGTSADCSAGIGFSNYTARRVDVSGCEDGLKLGDNTTVVDSYIHDLRRSSDSHSDGMQASGDASNIVVRGNTVMGPYRATVSALKFSTQNGKLDDILIEGNYLHGGNYTIYMDDKNRGHGPATDTTVRHNVIEKGSFSHGWRTYDGHSSQSWTDNLVVAPVAAK